MTQSGDDLKAERKDHPDELLAGLVDGSLDEQERTRVEAHLASCSECRRDLPLALRAAGAVSSLPEMDVPLGLTRAAVDQARAPRTPSRMWAWVAAPAAAAVVALAVWAAVAGGGGGGGGGAAPSAGGGGAGGTAAPAPEALDSRVKVSNVNFDQPKIQALADRLSSRGARTEALGGGPKRAAGSADKAFAQSDPIACVRATARPTKNDELFEVLVAKFEGTPAYIAVFLHRPGAGQPPSLLAIWVASQNGCRLLHYASEPLNR
jgi:Putative zinc-finger